MLGPRINNTHNLYHQWRATKGSQGHEQYLFLRALFYLGLCILGIGAMGDNISARRASSFSKELSILLGASILGGVVWTVSDLLASIILKFKR